VSDHTTPVTLLLAHPAFPLTNIFSDGRCLDYLRDRHMHPQHARGIRCSSEVVAADALPVSAAGGMTAWPPRISVHDFPNPHRFHQAANNSPTSSEYRTTTRQIGRADVSMRPGSAMTTFRVKFSDSGF